MTDDDNDTTREDIWTLLEQDAPEGCTAVQDLYSWSLNFDAGKGPFSLFVDLIGWSDENFGTPIYAGNDPATGLGYVELSKLGAALVEYSDRPGRVRDYVDQLINAEAS